MCQQGVDERSGGPARSGMNHQPRRLVEDQQVLVLVEDVEGNRLGREGQGFEGWNGKRHPLAGRITWRDFWGWPPTRTAPRSIRSCTRARDRPLARARKTSSRCPASPSPTVNSCNSGMCAGSRASTLGWRSGKVNG